MAVLNPGKRVTRWKQQACSEDDCDNSGRPAEILGKCSDLAKDQSSIICRTSSLQLSKPAWKTTT